MQKLIQVLPGALPDVLLVTGSAVLSYGAGLIHVPAGFIVGGLLLIAGGLNAAKKDTE